jgi:hypothetical protein
MEFLVVVRRDQPVRFATLREAFAEEPVEVIWDRRRGDRRRAARAVGLERRRGDRRRRPPATWRDLDFLLTPRPPGG